MTIDEMKVKLADIMDARDYRPMARIELAVLMGVAQQDRSEFFSCLRALENEGVISISKSKKIKPVKKPHAVSARMLTVANTGGYAALDDGSGDIFIPRQKLGGAMPTDLIEVRILNRRGRLPEAEVLRVSQRNFTEFTGTLTKRGKKAYVVPDSGYKDKIEVLHRDVGDAKDKDKVLAHMKTYPGRGDIGTAAVVTAYGSAQKASACCEAVLDRRHIRRAFQPAVLEEAVKVSKEPVVLTDDRVDLRSEIIFTIDGAHTKDIDDAVSVAKTEEGYRLGVHIADVSHYVRPGSELDNEAYLRGTSIYYADSVIPMLPRELSNGICSLNPQEDRYAFSAVMEIGADGSVLSGTLHKSMIRSRVKGVYEEINRIFDGSADKKIQEKYAEVLPVLPTMRSLAQLLGRARQRRGALDFESGDCEIILDDEGVAEDVRRRERGESEQLIEEFMLCANEAVAKLASERKIPFVYRVHEEPELAKLEGLAAALRAAGIDARAIRSGLKPGDVAKVLEKIAGSPKEKALNGMVLRSLAKARYSPECLGHFGLALEFYSHFTSPIRRYPDLAIHRILSDLVQQKTPESITRRYRNFADSAAEQSSGCELTAMQVEWDCDDIYKAEYMSRHIGETFEGVISSVKSFGMYVELPNSVEGLVRVDKIPGGWFDYDESTLSFYCEKTGVRFSIGDSVRVIASRADVSNGQIDFEII